MRPGEVERSSRQEQAAHEQAPQQQTLRRETQAPERGAHWPSRRAGSPESPLRAWMDRMAEDDKHGDSLWMFRRQKAGPQPRGVDVDPASDQYSLFKNTRNPYLRRAVAPAPRTEGELTRLVRVLAQQQRYQVAPSNQAQPYQRRQLAHPPPPPEPAARFQQPQALSGDQQHLPVLVDGFFRSILTRLEADPQRLHSVVQELVQLFQANRMSFRHYEAYHAFEDWNDLMDTLRELAKYPSPETFDLFCGALMAYHELAYPP